jgi:integrase/recombinase XerC
MQTLIDEYVRTLVVEENASPHTVRNYASDLRQLRTCLLEHRLALDDAGKDVAADRVDHLAIRAFMGDLLRRNSKSSVGRKLSAAKQFFRFLLRRGLRTLALPAVAGPKASRQPPPWPRQ